MAEARQIKLYEALELRGEYDARIKTLRDCLPEARHSRRDYLVRDDRGARQPAPGFDLAQTRRQIAALEFKRRKLNAAIQRANFEHRLAHADEEITLTEALEARKAVADRLGELHGEVVDAAWNRVIHKEERDIVEPNQVSFEDCRQRLDAARVEFRQLNRSIRAASFEVAVDFADEA